jgi:hypothetical protein
MGPAAIRRRCRHDDGKGFGLLKVMVTGNYQCGSTPRLFSTKRRSEFGPHNHSAPQISHQQASHSAGHPTA